MALAPLPSILNFITSKVKLAFTFLWWEKIGKEDLLSWAPSTALHDTQKTLLRTLWHPSSVGGLQGRIPVNQELAACKEAS